MERSEQDVERWIWDMHLINKLKRGEREREIYRDGSVSGAIEHNNLTSVGGW